MEQAKDRIAELSMKLAVADHNYYVLDDPKISDAEYDALYRELVQLEKQYPQYKLPFSPSQRVSGGLQAGFMEGKHGVPMLSIRTETDFTYNGALNFDAYIRQKLELEVHSPEVEYVAELKFDGLGINLRYEHGILVRALTRGTGHIGEDVTANVRMIRSIPLVLPCGGVPDVIEVRGETVMKHADFHRLNETQDEKGLKRFVNPRNAAAGSVRQLDPEVTASRKLSFFAYGIGEVIGEFPVTCQRELLEWFKQHRFPVCDEWSFTIGGNGLRNFFHRVGKLRIDLPFDIDGIVYKVNRFDLQQKLGYVSREPVWALAHKFQAEEMPTVVEAIDVQVGRTGKLTPVARLREVFVGGVNVTNATLHNESEIQNKDIRVGDTVLVRRAGDVVPEVVSVLLDRRPTNAVPYVLPKHCPVCGSKATKAEDKANWYCEGGVACSAQRKAINLHFAQRRAMDIDGVGDSLVDQLVDRGLVSTPADLYRLTVDDLMQLDKIGEKSAQNLLDAIEASKRTSLARFIFALGIHGVGESTARDLAWHFQSFEKFSKATFSPLLEVKDIGPTTALNIMHFFESKVNRDMIASMFEAGVMFVGDDQVPTAVGPFTDKTVVLTGTLSTLSREEAKDRIQQQGGTVSGSVSANTSYLVAGADAGTKLKRAQELKIPILDETQFLSMLQ